MITMKQSPFAHHLFFDTARYPCTDVSSKLENKKKEVQSSMKMPKPGLAEIPD
jgi:hypothetical protein